MDVRLDDWQQVGRRRALDGEGTGRPAALNQRHDGMLVGVATLFRHVLLLADERLVDLYYSALATHRRQGARCHRLADAMRHEPGCLVGDVQRSHELVAADALLGGAHQVNSLKPQVKSNVAGLEHRADRDRELALARTAAAQAHPAALDRRDPLRAPATWAHWAMRPEGCL